MKHKSRNILSVKRKRSRSAINHNARLSQSGTNVSVGVESVCRTMSGHINRVKIITV